MNGNGMNGMNGGDVNGMNISDVNGMNVMNGNGMSSSELDLPPLDVTSSAISDVNLRSSSPLEKQAKRDPFVPILFTDPICDACRSVHWLCIEAGIPLYLRPTWLWRGDNRKSEYVENINPRHQVPALQHQLKNGETFLLAESHAIMQYLCELHGPEIYGKWFGVNEYERALVTEFLAWHHSGLKKTLMKDYLVPMYFLPVFMGTHYTPRPDSNTVSKLRTNCHEHLLQLNTMLNGKKYLVNDRLTVADILICPTIVPLMDMEGEKNSVLSEFPAVSAWVHRLRKREAFEHSNFGWRLNIELVREHNLSNRQDPAPLEIDAWEKYVADEISFSTKIDTPPMIIR